MTVNEHRQTFKELKPGDIFYTFYCEGNHYRKLDNAFGEDPSGFVHFISPDTFVVVVTANTFEGLQQVHD